MMYLYSTLCYFSLYHAVWAAFGQQLQQRGVGLPPAAAPAEPRRRGVRALRL